MTNRVSTGGVKLPPASFRAEAPLRSETARSLAGRASELYELATGESCVAGQRAITRTNPQGLTGWDLSGPPWGSALLHPLFWVSGRSANTGILHQPTFADQTERTFGDAVGPASFTTYFWVRAHDTLPAPYVAPYGRLSVVIRTHRLSGATTPTATLRVWNSSAGQDRQTARSDTFTAAAASTTFAFNNTLTIDAVPGDNQLQIEVSTPDADTSVFYIESLMVQCVVKRTH